eukprot:TRINITY_DN13171_c0_g1_i1.p1 TRINITY_DN13171_c0_g1~~TRINITY_DN13171_c0_g1_i1.p1  ORF type:complete len:211 (-),score=34.15 TRINITY_DN13171_c0_g1_i1:81-692(-)
MADLAMIWMPPPKWERPAHWGQIGRRQPTPESGVAAVATDGSSVEAARGQALPGAQPTSPLVPHGSSGSTGGKSGGSGRGAAERSSASRQGSSASKQLSTSSSAPKLTLQQRMGLPDIDTSRPIDYQALANAIRGSVDPERLATLTNPNSVSKHSVARTASGTLYIPSPAGVLHQPGGPSGKIQWQQSSIWRGPINQRPKWSP